MSHRFALGQVYVTRGVNDRMAIDTSFSLSIESPKISSFGIGVMLSICLQVFPDYFQKFELWQEN